MLTPGLVQMVSVLALNKLELKSMIDGELVENPVLEEVDESTETLDERAAREGDRERSAEEAVAERVEKDPFDEVDFGSYFQDYLDPGYRTGGSLDEDPDRPSFENFLSQPSTLTDHLLWQVGALALSPKVRACVELMIGNLNEDGYLTATNEELAEGLAGHPTKNEDVLALVEQGRNVMRQLDPAGVGARDLRECLLWQIEAQRRELELVANRPGNGHGLNGSGEILKGLDVAVAIVESHLPLLQRKDLREIARVTHRQPEVVQEAVEYIRRLDPRPGQRYNQSATRLIEPDVAFVKRGDEYVVVMNDENMPSLRLNNGYRQDAAREGNGARGPRVCEGALPVGDSVAAKYRAAEEHDCANVRCDCAAAAGVSGEGCGGAAADDDQGGRRRDRRASFDGEPRGGE